MTKRLIPKSPTIRAVASVLSGHAGASIVRLAGNLIVTRILAPDMFGVMSLVLTLAAAAEMISDLGVKQSIIRSKRADDLVFLRTAFSFNVMKGLAVFVALNTLSVFMYARNQSPGEIETTVWADERLPYAMSMFSLVFIFKGLQSIEISVQEKQMKFFRVSLFSFLNQFLSTILVIVLATISPNIFALAGGPVIAAAVVATLSYVMFPTKAYLLGWEKGAASEIYSLGKWLMVSSGFNFLSRQSDKFIFGALLTPVEMGTYAIAFMLSEAVKSIFGKLLQVWYSKFVSAGDGETEKSGEIYYRVRLRQDPIMFFISGFLIAGGSSLVDLLYDDRYRAAGPILELLSISIALSAFQMKGLIFTGLGVPRYMAQVTAINTVAIWSGLPIAFWMCGFHAAVLWVAINSAIGTFLSVFYFYKLNMLRPLREVMFLPVLAVGYACGSLLNELV